MWIHAKNGNWVQTSTDAIAEKALADGHEVFTTEDDKDPREKGVKPLKWDPTGAAEPEPQS